MWFFVGIGGGTGCHAVSAIRLQEAFTSSFRAFSAFKVWFYLFIKKPLVLRCSITDKTVDRDAYIVASNQNTVSKRFFREPRAMNASRRFTGP
jgi:hypothetical protein